MHRKRIGFVATTESAPLTPSFMDKSKSKERLTEILLSFDEGAEIHGYREVGGTIEFVGENGEPLTPSYAAIGSGYEKNSGSFKSTARVDIDPKSISANVPDWVGQFEKIYAVDTNTIELDGQKICVTCSVRAEIAFEGNRWNGQVYLLDALIFCNPKFKPELIGWMDVIGRLNSDGSSRVGIVVDSERDRIPSINLRREPIAEGFPLPGNITLIYASSERDKNLPFNFIIAKCDSDAKFLINKIKNDRTRLDHLKASDAGLYESGYYWAPKRVRAKG